MNDSLSHEYFLLPYLQCVLISSKYFKTKLGGEFTEPSIATDLNKLALVNKFIGYSLPDIKDEIVRQYCDANVPLFIILTVILWHVSDCSVAFRKNSTR